ncbi:hypothetical protein DIPPA_55059 [Diplonema papillatum]|nr:hypothetical protein DIPPA_55059 [Diplonema papillatum]
MAAQVSLEDGEVQLSLEERVGRVETMCRRTDTLCLGIEKVIEGHKRIIDELLQKAAQQHDRKSSHDGLVRLADLECGVRLEKRERRRIDDRIVALEKLLEKHAAQLSQRAERFEEIHPQTSRVLEIADNCVLSQRQRTDHDPLVAGDGRRRVLPSFLVPEDSPADVLSLAEQDPTSPGQRSTRPIAASSPATESTKYSEIACASCRSPPTGLQRDERDNDALVGWRCSRRETVQQQALCRNADSTKSTLHSPAQCVRLGPENRACRDLQSTSLLSSASEGDLTGLMRSPAQSEGLKQIEETVTSLLSASRRERQPVQRYNTMPTSREAGNIPSPRLEDEASPDSKHSHWAVASASTLSTVPCGQGLAVSADRYTEERSDSRLRPGDSALRPAVMIRKQANHIFPKSEGESLPPRAETEPGRLCENGIHMLSEQDSRQYENHDQRFESVARQHRSVETHSPAMLATPQRHGASVLASTIRVTSRKAVSTERSDILFDDTLMSSLATQCTNLDDVLECLEYNDNRRRKQLGLGSPLVSTSAARDARRRRKSSRHISPGRSDFPPSPTHTPPVRAVPQGL